MQGVLVSLMLLWALYGIAQAMSKAAVWFWRPKKPELTVLLTLSGQTEGAEQQVRFAYYVAKEQRLPLTVTEGDANEETVRIVRRVLNARGVATEEQKNACTETQTRV